MTSESRRQSNVTQATPIRPERLELASLISDVALAYGQQLENARIEVELDVPHNLWVELDPVLMRDAFRKLVDNAIEALSLIHI